MPENDRGPILRQALTASGFPCGPVTRVFFRGFDSGAKAYWSVADQNGEVYCIAIDKDAAGSTTILTGDMMKLTNIDPWEPFAR